MLSVSFKFDRKATIAEQFAPLAGRTSSSGLDQLTVTPAVALTTFAPPPVMVADPGATPFTGTFTLVEFARNVTVAGTVATPVLLELTLMVNPPAGAGSERNT